MIHQVNLKVSLSLPMVLLQPFGSTNYITINGKEVLLQLQLCNKYLQLGATHFTSDNSITVTSLPVIGQRLLTSLW